MTTAGIWMIAAALFYVRSFSDETGTDAAGAVLFLSGCGCAITAIWLAFT